MGAGHSTSVAFPGAQGHMLEMEDDPGKAHAGLAEQAGKGRRHAGLSGHVGQALWG